MKSAALWLLFILSTISSSAQMCPGGGVDFSSAVTFDPSWIYGCNTGTSCNGGVAFDNTTACQPTTAIDVCAPAPTCGTLSNDASDIWFKFYPTMSTVTISCFQNSSFVIGIQAFSGGPTCGSLTSLGCALSGGPSSGVQLTLNGLTPGTLYYFRIYGSAPPGSQRTGIYCFCGTTGLSNIILSAGITDFNGITNNNGVLLKWTLSSGDYSEHIELERSSDGHSFSSIASIPETVAGIPKQYSYYDVAALDGNNFYRLKRVYADGRYDYSDVIAVQNNHPSIFTILSNSGDDNLRISSKVTATLLLSDVSGRVLQTLHLLRGINTVSPGNLSKGVYFLSTTQGKGAQSFYIMK